MATKKKPLNTVGETLEAIAGIGLGIALIYLIRYHDSPNQRPRVVQLPLRTQGRH